jgi:hypothetical protein
MMYKLVVMAVALSLITGLAEAACIFGGGVAGQNAAYHYAFAYINSIIAADAGLKRISKISKGAKQINDYPSAVAAFANDLKEYELAARDFECAASIIEPQGKFSPSGSSEIEKDQTELARETATLAELFYLRLSKETRELASIFVARMKDSLTDVEFAERAARVSANLHDLPRELFSLTPSVPQVLIDPKPDSANRMSRLRITATERKDLIDNLDQGFGKGITESRKGDRPALEAAAALLRQWLATSGHTPLP